MLCLNHRLFLTGTVLWTVVSARSMELTCCIKLLFNGSVSYTLNSAVSNGSTTSWVTTNNTVIVDEDGDFDKNVVLCKTKDGYILRQNYVNVSCKLENPQDGVSKEIPCSEAHCEPMPPTPTPVDPRLTRLAWICLPILIIFLLSFLGYKFWQRTRRRDEGTDVEMMPVNDQQQDQ